MAEAIQVLRSLAFNSRGRFNFIQFNGKALTMGYKRREKKNNIFFKTTFKMVLKLGRTNVFL